jgi:hypothetical protein
MPAGVRAWRARLTFGDSPVAERRKLTDILTNSEKERLERAWSTTAPAADLAPIPPGEYRCRVASGALFESKSGTPGYKLALEVADGEHAGRRLWHDVWLSAAALPMARRDLAKLGVEHLEQLESPLPEGIVVAAKVALRKGDDGAEYNRVVRFDVVAIEPPEPEPFAPAPPPEHANGNGKADRRGPDRLGEADTLDGDGFDWSTGEAKGVPAP